MTNSITNTAEYSNWLTRDPVVMEYVFSDIQKPMAVSEWSFSDNLKSSLPSIETLEAELAADGEVREEGI